MAEPVRFEYHLEARAPIDRVFRALSDTDAFNRLAKANMTFSQETQADGSSKTIGSVKKLGMVTRWQEKPFSFRRPHWFRAVRVFESGPAEGITATCTLTSAGDTTKVHYLWEMGIKSGILRPVINFDARRTIEPHLRAALDAAIAHAEKEAENDLPSSYAGPPPALSAEQAGRLRELSERLLASPLRDRLVAFLRAAPERDQLSMSPIALAQGWAAPLEEVALLLIAGAKVGLLGVRVDLLCPACLVAKAAVDESGKLPDVHCDSCEIPLDASYPEGLAVHFFPSPTVRPLNVRTECIGSPSKTPNVVAQEALAPGAEVDLATTLEPGTYQLRTLPAVGPAALLDVRQSDAPKEAAFTLRGSMQPQLARVRPDVASLRVTNASQTPVFVLLERIEPPRRVVSLGRMLVEYPVLKELIPATGFITSLSAFDGVAVSLRAVSPEYAASLKDRLASARLTYVSGPVVLAIYADLDRANADLAQLDLPRLLIGVAEGVVSESRIGGKAVPVGTAIDAAYAAMCQATFGRINFSELAS